MKWSALATVVLLGFAAIVQADTILDVQADTYLLHSYYAGWTTPDGGATWNAGYAVGEILGNAYGDSSRNTMTVLDSKGPGANGASVWGGTYDNHPVSTWHEDYMDGSYIRRSIVQFDLTGIVDIGNATLSVRTVATTVLGIRVYRGTRAFVETEASWNEYASGSAWDTPGGDFDNSRYSLFTTPGTLDWVSVDVSDLIRDALGAAQSTATLFLLADDNDLTATFQTRHYTPPGGSPGDYGATLSIGDPIPEPALAGVLGLLRRRRIRS